MRSLRSLRVLRVLVLGGALASVGACAPGRGRGDANESDDGVANDAPTELASLDDGGRTDGDAAADALETSLGPEVGALDARDEGSMRDGASDDRGADAGRDVALEAAVEPCPTAGFTRCGAQCVDLAASAEHCGACGVRCAPGANATATCIAGECDRACAMGFGDCNRDVSDGCETSLVTTAHCGACGRVCAGGEVCSAGTCARLETVAPPQQRAPLSGARVLRRRPTFRLAYAAGVPAMAELQLCRTRACTDATATVVQVTGDRYVPSSDLAVGVHFWRVRARDGARTGMRYSPVWQLRVLPGSERSDVATSFDADFNGDGRADVAVGAYEADSLLGAAWVYYGTNTVPSSTPDWRGRPVDSSGPTNCYGSRISHGDFNGDGFVDLAVSDPCSGFSAGRVYVYNGSDAGLPSTQSSIFPGPDGRSDFGHAMSPAGDVNGDGYADLLVGAPFTSEVDRPRTGAAYLLHGSAAGTFSIAWSQREATRSTVRLGREVAGAGDVDGDGRADVILGAPGDDLNTETYATAFLGGPAGLPLLPSTRYEGPTTVGPYFASALSSAGDVDGDGYADVLLGAWRANSSDGFVWLLRGSGAGFSREPSQVLTRAGRGQGIGSVLAGGDDIDGDGFCDAVISQSCSAAFVRGSASGLLYDAATLLTDGAGVSTGFCSMGLSMPGDVDGDGFSDVVMGSGSNNGGRGFVGLFRGTSAGVSTRPIWFVRGPAPNISFGWSLSR